MRHGRCQSLSWRDHDGGLTFCRELWRSMTRYGKPEQHPIAIEGSPVPMPRIPIVIRMDSLASMDGRGG